MGELSFEQMFERLNIAIHQFAKRQMTWFRKMERNGFQIHWVDANDSIEDRLSKIKELLQG
ncbi:tRNA delta(2)-isopentenylpyrophosphate transferase [Saccharicrinis fermentans DSM 9555 = JCM 21142]|uniref:tRNA delta(2)-isopentenylpyrophosphate transferase n=2 Tax=Saccharicrinis fermentans TaxID=982 RepID=W7XZS9_9BACT|nr:tRNA delta(2)-isopentenylpyrophosphate transferase [Saccharicrinis fermentans DSM 9555 = JCM 21142]